jgi:hypothetical protein
MHQIELKRLRLAALRMNWLKPDGYTAFELACAAAIRLAKSKEFMISLADGFSVVGKRPSASGKTKAPLYKLTAGGRRECIELASPLRAILGKIEAPGYEVIMATVIDLESAVEHYESLGDLPLMRDINVHGRVTEKLLATYADYDAALDVAPELAGELRDRADACLARINAVIRRGNPKAPGVRLD